MSCPSCGGEVVAFAVPDDLQAYAPGEHAAICTDCLRTHRADAGADDPDFSRVATAIPDGRAGIAVALLLGRLGSLALNRREIEALCEKAERAGADVWLTLDRLDGADVEPYFDLDRRREQLDDLL